MEIDINIFNYAIVVLDKDRNVVECNKSFLETFSVLKNEIAGRKFSVLSDKLDCLISDMIGKGNDEDIVECSHGEKNRCFKIILSPLSNDNITVTFIACSSINPYLSKLYYQNRIDVYRNITDLISIEYNNHLTAILGFASFAKTSLNPESEMYKFFNTIENSAINAASLTNQLLTYTGIDYFRQKLININKIITQTVTILRKVFPSSIRIDLSLYPAELPVFWDENQINQLIINTVMNAKEAIDLNESVGRICISTDRDNDFIYIRVEDDGPGIPEEYRGRIFQKNFTTKNLKLHSGLGLSVSDGIIKNMGGRIELDTEEYRGSVFTFIIPDKVISIDKIEEAEEAVSHDKKEAVILVIDDKSSIRNLAAILLKSKGYKTLTASDHIEAMKIISEDDVDLVLLDIMMPGVRGDELYFKIIEKKPNIPVIALTGTTNEQIVDSLVKEHNVGLILKPFKNEEFFRTIEKKLWMR